MNNFIQKLYNSSPIFYKIYQESFLKTPLHKLKQFVRFLNFKTKTAWEYLQTIPRRLGYKDPRYSNLLAMKDKYKGKRCFITCTGPSLTIEDLEKLEGEYAFGMNSISMIHDKTQWKPDFFGVQDIYVYAKIKDYVLSTDNGIVFVPYPYKKRFSTPADWVYFHMSGSYHLYERSYGPRYFSKFTDNGYVTIYDGYSIMYSILQLVVYMGFEEIYLLGADCSYSGDKKHFIEHGSNSTMLNKATEMLFASYREAKKYADAHGIKIYNATRGGCLEIFPRVTLEDVLARNEKNKRAE